LPVLVLVLAWLQVLALLWVQVLALLWVQVLELAQAWVWTQARVRAQGPAVGLLLTSASVRLS
jgi:hypothetical protein